MLLLCCFFFSILFCRHRCRRHTYSLAVFPSLCLSLCRLALHLYWQTHSLSVSLTLSAILSRIVHAYTRTHVQRHAYMCTFICISMQMSKRRQHRHIALFHLPPASQSHSHSLSLSLSASISPCGEYAASVADFVCAGIALAAAVVVISFLGLAFVEQQGGEWGMRSVQKGAFYLQSQRQTERWERRQTCGQWCSTNFENSPPIAGGPLQMRCSAAARSPPPLRTAYTPLSLSLSLLFSNSPLTALRLVCAFVSSRHRFCFILQIVWPNNCIFCNT